MQHLEEDGEVFRSLTFVNGNVAIGNFGAAISREFLERGKINAIVGLTDALREVSPESIGVAAVALHPFKDGAGNTVSELRNVVNSITKFVNMYQRVLVHCHAGRSRSVVAVAAFLCMFYGYSPFFALQHIKSLRETAIAPELLTLLTEFYNSECVI